MDFVEQPIGLGKVPSIEFGDCALLQRGDLRRIIARPRQALPHSSDLPNCIEQRVPALFLGCYFTKMAILPNQIVPINSFNVNALDGTAGWTRTTDLLIHSQGIFWSVLLPKSAKCCQSAITENQQLLFRKVFSYVIDLFGSRADVHQFNHFKPLARQTRATGGPVAKGQFLAVSTHSEGYHLLQRPLRRPRT
jgi:hypothetical protein